ncbi:hypothetical protein [Cereibacter changlensis]|uniref:hypothetical protein n=1 Tax=Cereibacter changlensis TaxID=402884 RepID=UPI004034A807
MADAKRPLEGYNAELAAQVIAADMAVRREVREMNHALAGEQWTPEQLAEIKAMPIGGIIPHRALPPMVTMVSDDDDELVTRTAPRWAWETIDETLVMDAQSKAFGQELRNEIRLATFAMAMGGESAENAPISREAVAEWMED